MNLQSLFFCVVCCMFINGSLCADSIHGTKDATIHTSTNNNEITIIVDTICDLLLHGNSADEIIEKLKKNKPNLCNIQKLVLHIQDFVN
ncbi:MAG: hypothetical protein V1855_03005, partial [bacterium]